MGSAAPLRLRVNPGAASAQPVIVIADRDPEVRDAVHGFMSVRGYLVEPAADADAAAGLLRDRKIDVLISELALCAAGGTDLPALARAAAPATRWIAIAAEVSQRERDAALRLGAVRVLGKPLSLLELADAIGLAHDCAEGFHGWMHRMSLVDVLQMYHHACQSLVIHVRGDVDIDGAIALRGGELIHAECRGQVGMPALVELLKAQRGQLETAALDAAIRTITGPFDHVLLDGLRALDEVRRPPPVAAMDGWLDEPADRAADGAAGAAGTGGIDRDALQRWLGEHAPGAGAWWIDPETWALERIDPPGPHAERELAGPPGALGWAYELAERGDPTWTRVELISGDTAVAVIRAAGCLIGLARRAPGEAVLRRFQLECARLVRWLSERAAGAGGGAR